MFSLNAMVDELSFTYKQQIKSGKFLLSFSSDKPKGKRLNRNYSFSAPCGMTLAWPREDFPLPTGR